MPSRLSTIRFSFQAKVLAPVLAFLVLLPTATLWIINHHISDQALAEARQTLTTADAVFRNSLDILNRGLATRFRGVVNEPRFKAVAQLGDARTMSDFLRDALEEFGGEIECMTYSVEPGTMLAGARREARLDYDTFVHATAGLSHDAFNGEIGTGTVFAAGRTFSVVSVPVLASDRLSVTGVLTIGLYFGNHSLLELKSLTRTEIVVFANGRVTATTLDGQWLPQPTVAQPVSAQGAQQVMPMEVGNEHFLALSGDYAVAEGRPGFHYLLLSSYEMRLRALQKTQLMLVGVSVLGILISAGSVWLMIRRVTQPLRVLRDRAESVGRGDFTRGTERYSNDECGELAGAFDRMTDNLLTSRTELQRTVDTLRSTDARLRESEEQLRLTIESARDHMICTLNRGGGVQRWNAAAERVLGYTTAEAQGLAYAAFFSAEERAAGVPEKLLSTAASVGREAFEGWRMRRDGSRFWADVTLSRLPDGAGFVEIARDSTLRKEAEETLRSARDTAETANRAKTEFIANMSHELRTPMNAIIGMSSLLLGDNLPEDTRESVQTIRTSADSLLEIIDDILDISNIEAGRLELNQQPYDLCGCIDHVIDLYAPRCRERGIDLAVHLARDLPAIVIGDAVRLRQVLGNILSNAIKFTERGGVTITVSSERSQADGERLLFSLQDTGIGIPADRMDRLFKMFSQVDGSTTRRFGGTGLGLAISKRLVELMGGTIALESEVGRGSRFHFSIKAQCEPLRTLPEFSGLEQRRILIVGTSSIATTGLRDQLSTWGADVWSAPVRDPSDNDFDIVILADGSAVESTDPIDTAVVRVVGWRESPVGTAAGRRVLLEKPVKPRALFAAVRKAQDLVRRTQTVAPISVAFSPDFGHQHPLRILLVEDNPVNGHVAQRLLKKLGYTADWVVNGRKALDRLEQQPYDAVLMDLQMPEMGGLEAMRLLTSTTPATQRPYVIALTANARKDDREACTEAGMQDFIAKPVELETLAQGLERAYHWSMARNEKSPAPRL